MHDNCQLSASSGFQVTSSLGSEFVFPKPLPFLQLLAKCGERPATKRGSGVRETARARRIPISYVSPFPERANGALLAIMALGANCQTLAHQR